MGVFDQSGTLGLLRGKEVLLLLGDLNEPTRWLAWQGQPVQFENHGILADSYIKVCISVCRENAIIPGDSMKPSRLTRALLPLALLPSLFCPALAFAQPDEIAQLREQLAVQQKQLDEQRRALESAGKALASAQAALDSQQKLLDRLLAGRSAPSAAPAQSAAQPQRVAPTPAATDKEQTPSPFSFRIGGADFAPGGFMDFATAWRSRNVGSGVATSFASVPYANSAAGRMPEFRSSAANSRMTLTITETPTKNMTLTGYLEGDFSGNQPSSLYVTSYSNTWRMRHFWVNLAHGKWEVLAGQAWTLLTPNRLAVSPVSSNVFVGLGEDSNYMPGLAWGRPGQLRVSYHPNSKWSVAASIENPEQFVTTATNLPPFAATQADNGSVPTTPNVRPDFVAKIAYDTRISGKGLHFEWAGFSRQSRTSPAPGKYCDGQGVGGSSNAVLEVARNFRLITNVFYSSGGGRYLAGLGPDFTVGPDGSISPVHSMGGIAGFEYAPTPKSQFFGYYGGAYFNRNYTLVGPGSYLGFGFPGSSSANRQFQEPVFGYYYTYWKNPKYGALQIIAEYAYLTRAPWYVAPGTPSTAHAHMVFTSLRFTLPQGGGQPTPSKP